MGTSPSFDVLRPPLHAWLSRLFPIHRALMGPGVRESLDILADMMPGLHRHHVKTGQKVLDWVVPDEWHIKGASIIHESGQKIVDYHDNPLHVIGYAAPVDTTLDREELLPHLQTHPTQDDVIPYVTSYYKRQWAFCMTGKQKAALPPGRYHVKIDSVFVKGQLDFADLIIPGESRDEILLSTYICHPSLANDNLSGVVVMAGIAAWLRALPTRHYTYRLVLVPETIGAIAYLAKTITSLKKHVRAGFVLSCLGDEGGYSYIASRHENTLADQIAEHAGKHHAGSIKKYSFLLRGSDERQYGAPGVDLPLVTLCRSKYGEFPEYHSSADNLSFVTAKGLQGGFDFVRTCLHLLEANKIYAPTILGEPQLGRRGLYPDLSVINSGASIQTLVDFLAYTDGQTSLLSIAEKLGVPALALEPIAKQLLQHNLLRTIHSPRKK
jgi:aminopeptidase-like protein